MHKKPSFIPFPFGSSSQLHMEKAFCEAKTGLKTHSPLQPMYWISVCCLDKFSGKGVPVILGLRINFSYRKWANKLFIGRR